MGPRGTGLYSLLLQVHALALAIATLGGGAQNSIVRGIAAHRFVDDRRIFLETAISILLITSVVATVSLFALGAWFARVASEKAHFFSIGLTRLMVLSVFAGVCASILLAVINGFGEMRALARISTINSVASLGLVFPAVYFAKLDYPIVFVAMIAVALGLQAFCAGILVLHKGWLDGVKLFRFSKGAGKDFIGLAGATFLTGLTAQGGALLLQAWILRSFGFEAIGILNAALAISTGYPMLLLNSITAYYLPALSGSLNEGDAKLLIRNMYRFALVAGIPLVTFVIAFQSLIVTTLYSPRFIAATTILRWMLIGGLLKTISWIFAMPVTARRELGLLVISEVAFNVLYVGAAISFSTRFHSLQVVGICYLAAYTVYLCCYVFYVNSRYPHVISAEEVITGIAGIAVVVFASCVLWNRTTVSLYGVLLLILALLGSWRVLSSGERAKVCEAVVLRFRRSTTG
jgi:PST family polysaccharide transporter